jgi:xylose dehydrogenase (NAD/NADP)
MSGIVWLNDGRMGSFDCGFTTPYRGFLEIVGTEAAIHVSDMWVPRGRVGFEVRREGRPPEEIVIEGPDQILAMIEDFGRAVLDGVKLDPAPEEAVRTLRVLDALAESAREAKIVDV